jgi:hypothetical protein
MPDLLALIYAVLLAVGWPLYDYFIDWPRFLRDLQKDPHGARRREYLSAILLEWLLTVVALSLWLRAGGHPRFTSQVGGDCGLRPVFFWSLWASRA